MDVTIKVAVPEKPGMGEFNGSPAELNENGDLLINGSNFPDLTVLDCSYNRISALNVSGSTALNNLNCGNNQLVSLDVSNNMSLSSLLCAYNQLAEIDVGGNSVLRVLVCDYNQLSAIDVSRTAALAVLSCGGNYLTEIDVSSNAALDSLFCDGNQLTELDVTNNSALANLTCANNQLQLLLTNDGLKVLRCDGNQLTELDVSGAAALERLFCENNQLTSLDLSNNVNLDRFTCTGNRLATLDLSSNTALSSVDCGYQYGNAKAYWENGELLVDLGAIVGRENLARITEVTGSGSYDAATGIFTAAVDSEQAGSFELTYSYDTYAPVEDALLEVTLTVSVPEGQKSFNGSPAELDENGNLLINEANFTDEAFRNYVKDSFDTDNDGTLTADEASAVTYISCPGKSITSLKGVEYFTELTDINCNDNQLAALDVSKNIALISLHCYNNQLTELDVSQNTELNTLGIRKNKLTSLDLSKNTKLTTLDCSNNQLAELNISQNTELESLYCYNNRLSELYVSNNTALTFLECSNNQLTTLNVSNNAELQTLFCGDNQLTELNVSTKRSIVTYIKFCQLIIVTCKPQQFGTAANIQRRQVIIVDVKINQCSILADVQFRQLVAAAVKISQCSVVADIQRRQLVVVADKISQCSISAHIKLCQLVAIAPKAQQLGIAANIQRRQFITIAEQCPQSSVISLYCYNNQLTEVNVSNNTALTEFNCGSNKLTTLDVSSNTELTRLLCGGNMLAVLDVSSNSKLVELHCGMQSIVVPADQQNGKKTVDMAKLVGEANLSRIANITGGSLDTATGIVVLNSNEECLNYNYFVDPEDESRTMLVKVGFSSGKIGSKLTWAIDSEGTLTISGSGAMPDYQPPAYKGASPWGGNFSIKKIVIGEGVTSIGSYAFQGCNSVESVSLPDTLTKIGMNAFEGCNSLTGVTIPKKVTSIGAAAFGTGGYAMDWINVAPENTAYVSINGVVFTKDKKTLVSYPSGKGGTYVVPDGVTRIGVGAFHACWVLEGVVLPNTLTEIGESAFIYCPSLSSVEIPGSVNRIGAYTFVSCTSLDSITFRHSSTAALSIGEWAFTTGDGAQTVIKVPDVNNINKAISGYDWAGIGRDVSYEQVSCTHSLVTEPAVAATCTEPGMTASVRCSVCGEVFAEAETIPALGHNFSEWVQTKAPTLTADGAEMRKCQNSGCTEKETRVIEHIVYVVSYDANGGTRAPAAQKLLAGNTVKLSTSKPTWTGYAFMGWATDPAAAEAEYAPGESVTPEASLTLYAVWKPLAQSVELRSGELGEDVLNGTAVKVDMAVCPTVSISAAAQPEDASQEFTWKSSSTSVATVDAEGTVTFVKPGTVTVTASAKDGSGKSANVKLTVIFKNEAKSFTAKLGETSLVYEQSTKIGLQLGDSARIDVFGTDKTAALDNADFTFTSSNAANVSVDAETGVVTAEKAGVSATITASMTGDPLKRKVSVTVKTVPVQAAKVSILPAEQYEAAEGLLGFHGVNADGNLCGAADAVSWALYVEKIPKGQPAQEYYVDALIAKADGSEAPAVKGSLTWASTATGIVTVREAADGSGIITVKANVDGACMVTATSKDVSKTQGSIAVYVIDYAPRLASGTLTLDSTKVGNVVLPLVSSYGNEIETVRFTDTKGNERADIAVDHDPITDEWLLSAKEYIANTTIRGQLVIGTEQGEYTLPLSVTVKNSLPTACTRTT